MHCHNLLFLGPHIVYNNWSLLLLTHAHIILVLFFVIAFSTTRHISLYDQTPHTICVLTYIVFVWSCLCLPVSYSHHFYVNDYCLFDYREISDQVQSVSDYCLFDYREISDQVQSALAQLEQERVAAVRRCQRAQEELKKKQNVSYILRERERHTHTHLCHSIKLE